MSLLSNLKQASKEKAIPRHPFAEQDLPFRYNYAVGLAMMAFADEILHDSERAALEELVFSLRLPADNLEKVIAAAKDAGIETINATVEALVTSDQKSLFLLEALRMAACDRNFSGEERQAVQYFLKMLQLNEEELAFLKEFAKLSFSKDQVGASKLLDKMLNSNHNMNLSLFSYVFPDLKYSRRVEGFTLKNDTLLIKYKAIVGGEIILDPGSVLDISGAELLMEQGSNIKLCGGKLIADGAKISASRGVKSGGMLIVAKDRAVELSDAVFDGNQSATIICLEEGASLKLQKCTFQSCSNDDSEQDYGGAITALGNNVLEIDGSSFENCKNVRQGGAIFAKEGFFDIQNTSFAGCSAINGGAIRILRANDARLTLKQCTFENCHAEKYGGAIALGKPGFPDGVASIKIYDTKYDNCSSGYYGGGVSVFCSYESRAIFENCSFTGCKSIIGKGSCLSIFSFSSSISLYKDNCSVINQSISNCLSNNSDNEHIFIDRYRDNPTESNSLL